ncbi:4Fe-4S binding protein, partial [Escherichia coli]|nr:4Fe-4S binding protein [Escherichia coli]
MTDVLTTAGTPSGTRAVPDAGDQDRTPLDRWLAEQRSLTAVERFSQRHDESTGALHATVWKDLVPLSAPRPGEQYRFEVDLDACTGCKACVSACHSLNGLDEGESFRT